MRRTVKNPYVSAPVTSRVWERSRQPSGVGVGKEVGARRGGPRSTPRTRAAAMPLDPEYGACTTATTQTTAPTTHLRFARGRVRRVRVVRADLLAGALPLEIDRLARGREARLVARRGRCRVQRQRGHVRVVRDVQRGEVLELHARVIIWAADDVGRHQRPLHALRDRWVKPPLGGEVGEKAFSLMRRGDVPAWGRCPGIA